MVQVDYFFEQARVVNILGTFTYQTGFSYQHSIQVKLMRSRCHGEISSPFSRPLVWQFRQT